MKKHQLRRAVRVWHKRVGIISALVVIFLSITGILLNHSSDFALDQTKVKSDILLKLYGREIPAIRTVEVRAESGAYLLSELGTQLYINESYLHYCDSQLVDGLKIGELSVVACEQSLLLFDASDSLLDVIAPSYGLPVPIKKLGRCGAGFCIDTGEAVFQVDSDNLSFTEVDFELEPPVYVTTTKSIEEAIYRSYGVADLSFERVILDLHAGRFLGKFGTWVLDIFALLFVFVAGTGIYIWLRSSSSRKPHRKKR